MFAGRIAFDDDADENVGRGTLSSPRRNLLTTFDTAVPSKGKCAQGRVDSALCRVREGERSGHNSASGAMQPGDNRSRGSSPNRRQATQAECPAAWSQALQVRLHHCIWSVEWGASCPDRHCNMYISSCGADEHWPSCWSPPLP